MSPASPSPTSDEAVTVLKPRQPSWGHSKSATSLALGVLGDSERLRSKNVRRSSTVLHKVHDYAGNAAVRLEPSWL